MLPRTDIQYNINVNIDVPSLVISLAFKHAKKKSGLPSAAEERKSILSPEDFSSDSDGVEDVFQTGGKPPLVALEGVYNICMDVVTVSARKSILEQTIVSRSK